MALNTLSPKYPAIPESLRAKDGGVHVIEGTRQGCDFIVAINRGRAEFPVMFSFDGGEWENTPYETMYFGSLSDQQVANRVWDWLADQIS